MIDFSKLADMSQAELRTLAQSQGIVVHHKCAPETIRKMIMDSFEPQPKVQEVQVEKVTQPVVEMSEADTRELLKDYLIKPDFTLTFPNDGSVVMSYRGAVESIHLTSNQRLIKVRAEIVSKGQRRPLALNQHFDSMITNGQSGYTNTVL
jgi:hypothetical protein